jgi:sugar O-acyltransferase (sialic acid O-acetyltransferase NeuD family)
VRQRLLIASAGHSGREVLSWALQIPSTQRDWDIAGFLDDRPKALDGLNLPVGIVGAPETYSFRPEDRVVVAIGDPAQRRAFVEMLAQRGARFTSVIHPSVIMGLNNTWGEGCIFCPGAILTTNVRVGKHVLFNCLSAAGHDAVIGDYCTISAYVDITGHAILGEGVFVGTHASVLPHARVGDGAVVGAGSVVLKKVAPGTSVMGVPAREIWKKPSWSKQQ